MARNESTRREQGIVVSCPFCEHERVTVRSDGETTCPSCEEALTVYVADEFTLVENDGWAVTVSCDTDRPLDRRTTENGV